MVIKELKATIAELRKSIAVAGSGGGPSQTVVIDEEPTLLAQRPKWYAEAAIATKGAPNPNSQASLGTRTKTVIKVQAAPKDAGVPL